MDCVLLPSFPAANTRIQDADFRRPAPKTASSFSLLDEKLNAHTNLALLRRSLCGS
jgi:hypothetical protein